MPRFLRGVDRALRASDRPRSAARGGAGPFGSWIGGDRDGNPNVTPEVTRKACLLSRWMAADLYLKEIEALRDELSMTCASAELRARAGDAREPYRELLRTSAALLATRDVDRGGAAVERRRRAGALRSISSARRWRSRCGSATRRWSNTGNGSIADGRLTDVLRRVAAFGVVLARLDIRQEADRHTEALDAITTALRLGSYADWDEQRRLEFLVSRARQSAAAGSSTTATVARGARRPRHVRHHRRASIPSRSAPT